MYWPWLRDCGALCVRCVCMCMCVCVLCSYSMDSSLKKSEAHREQDVQTRTTEDSTRVSVGQC